MRKLSESSAVFNLAILEVVALLIFILIIVVTNLINKDQIYKENQQYVQERLSSSTSLYNDWTECISFDLALKKRLIQLNISGNALM